MNVLVDLGSSDPRISSAALHKRQLLATLVICIHPKWPLVTSSEMFHVISLLRVFWYVETIDGVTFLVQSQDQMLKVR